MWGAESSRAGSPPPRYVPVRRRTPVGGFDGRGSSSPMQGGAVVGGPGGKTKGSSVSSGVRGGGAALAAMGSNRQFSPGSGDFISRAPPPSPTFGAPVATVAGAPSQRSARTKSLNCARETVYEKTLRKTSGIRPPAPGRGRRPLCPCCRKPPCLRSGGLAPR